MGEVFEYVIQEGDLDTDGVAIKADSISLDGGFIKDQAGNDAILTHNSLPADPGHRVDAVSPTVTSVAITSDPGDDDTYDHRRQDRSYGDIQRVRPISAMSTVTAVTIVLGDPALSWT